MSFIDTDKKINDIIKKIEHYCAYQERCHKEVIDKLKSLKSTQEEIDTILVYLINNNFLNEERFAINYARGKHSIKKWGKTKIESELKLRNISKYNVNKALIEIPPEEYNANFHTIADRYWCSIVEDNIFKKKKKFCDYLFRKGYESHLVYQKLEDLDFE